MDIKLIAKEVFIIEAREVLNLSNSLTDDFENAVDAIFKSKGKLIVSGMGKSGIIGRKIQLQCPSTGDTKAFLYTPA